MKKKAVSKTLKSAAAKEAKAKETLQQANQQLAVPKNDSTNVLAVEPDSGAADSDSTVLEADADSTNVPQLPTPEQLGISIATGRSGDTLQVTVGDTVDFPVTVSWSVNGSAILVVPTSSANAKGIMQLGMSQESSRTVKDGQEMAQITFNYKLVVQDTGNLNIPAMRFEIPTPMGQSLDLRSESVPVRAELPLNPLPIIVGVVVALCVIVAGVWRVRRRSVARVAVAQRSAAENALREKMMVLKQRVNVADSREWLLELESICKGYVAQNLGFTGDSAASVNLDNLVKEGKLEGWESLVEEFAHARYGGGKRNSFENKETWKTAMALMGVKEDE